MQRLVLLLLLALSSGFGVAQSLRVVCADIAPYCFVSDGVPQGFAYEVGKEIVQRLGYETKIEIMPLARALHTVQTEDNVISLWVGRTPDRERSVQWVSLLFTDGFYVYTLKGKPDGSTLEKASLLKVLGANIAAANTQAARKHGLNSIEAISSDDSNGRKLLAERIDGWVTAQSAAEYFITRRAVDPSMLVRGVKLDDYFAYVAASLGLDAAEVNRWRNVLQAMKRDGSLSRLKTKYRIRQ